MNMCHCDNFWISVPILKESFASLCARRRIFESFKCWRWKYLFFSIVDLLVRGRLYMLTSLCRLQKARSGKVKPGYSQWYLLSYRLRDDISLLCGDRTDSICVSHSLFSANRLFSPELNCTLRTQISSYLVWSFARCWLAGWPVAVLFLFFDILIACLIPRSSHVPLFLSFLYLSNSALTTSVAGQADVERNLAPSIYHLSGQVCRCKKSFSLRWTSSFLPRELVHCGSWRKP